MKRLKYKAPAILGSMTLSLQESILTGSVTDKVSVESKGQDVVQYNFSDSSNEFNHTWEN